MASTVPASKMSSWVHDEAGRTALNHRWLVDKPFSNGSSGNSNLATHRPNEGVVLAENNQGMDSGHATVINAYQAFGA